jgi:hypothetical protein
MMQYRPETLTSYEDSYVITKDANTLYAIMKGETRNIIQGFFSPLKKIIGVCQQKGCDSTQLETAHMHKDRPEIFIEAANESKPQLTTEGLLKFDIYLVMKGYLEKHKGKSICFLCKKHHNELDRLRFTNKKEFLKYIHNINTD